MNKSKGVIFDLDQTLIDSSIAEAERASRRWNQVYSMISNFKLFPGALDLLNFLRDKNIAIAVVTNSPSIYAEKVLSHFAIGYDLKVCFHDVSRRKPFPDAYLRVMNDLNLDASNTYALGDRDIDIIAAQAAGITSCGCGWGLKDKSSLINSNPDVFFESFEDSLLYFKNTFP